MTRALGVLLAMGTLAGSHSVRAQASLSGAAQTQLALDRLAHRGSALMIAAHPDDENTALLAWLARGRHARTGYLSLTRGEGGQNLIGAEQGQLLGVIRTQELLAARRIDGAEQFFTRAVDFGYSKTVEETLERWGREQVLSDVVYVIRRFRPDVIILRFSGTPRDGHGHHQASAILGREAFEAAADPTKFPEQLGEVKPWRARRLVWNAFAFTPQQEKEAAALAGRIEVDLGEYDPLLGYSYSEIAGISRSQHRSQGMGSPERRGAQKNYLVHIAGDPAAKDIFDGIDRTAPAPELAEAARTFDAREPARTIPLLLRARAAAPDKQAIDEAIALCAGLFLDASADRSHAAWDSSVRITLQALNRSRFPLELVSVDAGPAGALSGEARLEYNRPVTRALEWQVKPMEREPLRFQPQQEPVLTARFSIRAGDQTLMLERPVWRRYVDKVRGELTQPFVVVPPVSVRIVETVSLFPSPASRRVSVQVRAFGAKRMGSVRLQLPHGWHGEPAERSFALAADEEEATLTFEIRPPDIASSVRLEAVATVDGHTIRSGVLVIDYPHIPPQTLFPPSEAKLVRSDVKVLAKQVGYVMGAGDEVADSLRQIGCEVTLLSAEDLGRGDLGRFDAIVTGVRAYNTRPDLRANHHRLMQYVENGGTVIVQYNVLEGGFMGGDPRVVSRIGPLPIRLSRDRVSVEDAPVETLAADHPVLTAPNRITASDWEGWVQERGLYFASEWDPRYQTIVSSHDPGEKPLAGGMLYTRHGKGVYIFTAYSWFRQLPAGVPGAWRIFANLLSAGQVK